MAFPYIKLFRTPNCNYFLDVNKDEFVAISESAFRYLNSVFVGEDSPELEKPQELIELEAQGYLSTESVVEEVRHPYTDYLKFFLERKLSKITLQVTQGCNFRCKYCIYSEESNARQRSHSSKRMSWDTAKKAIDFLWEHSVDSPDVNISFYGGEPLLEFHLIQRAVEYAEKRFEGKKLSFSMTSNGTLLNDEMIDYFQDHKISLTISLDGPKEINDQNRVFANGQGTFDAVMERIEQIKKIAPEYSKSLSISMVIDPENDFDCINSICLDSDDAARLNVLPSIVERSYDDAEVSFSDEYIWKYQYQRFLALLSHFNRVPAGEVSPIAAQSLSLALQKYGRTASGIGLYRVDVPSGPCIPGQLRLLVNATEQLFPCERVSETSPVMCIGTLEDGFDLTKANQLLNVGRLTQGVCRQCWCFRYCTICAKKADSNSETLSEKAKLSFCQEIQSSVYSELRQHLLLMEIPSYYQQQIRNESMNGR